MIPRQDGPWQPLDARIAEVEAHRARLRAGYIAAIVAGRAPTEEETHEHKRDERAQRIARTMRNRTAVRRAALEIVDAEYRRWLAE